MIGHTQPTHAVEKWNRSRDDFVDWDSVYEFFAGSEWSRQSINLEEVPRDGIDLSGASFTGDRLDNWQLTGANLCWADFSHVVLNGARLDGAVICGARFTTSEMQRTSLRGADLTESLFCGGAILVGADLAGADLTGAVFDRVRIDKMNLAGADLTDVQWRNVAGVLDGHLVVLRNASTEQVLASGLLGRPDTHEPNEWL